MATTTGVIRIIVEGVADGIRDMARDAERHLKKIQDDTDKVDQSLRRALGAGTKLSLGLGALGNALPILAGVAGSATTAAGALLVLPAAGLGAAAAITTLKIATAGFSDAVTAADPKAFAEATKEMAPAAIETATALRNLRPEVVALRQEVQQAFFRDFAADAQALGQTYLPVLRPQLAGIATEFNAMGREAARALLAPDAVADVNTVLGATRTQLGDLTPALANVLDGILAIAGQGAREFGNFGQAVTIVTGRFAEWARTAAETGRITQLIQEGKDELSDYAEVAGNVGDIVGTIFEGLSQGGLDLSGSLVESTEALEAFLASAEGQDALAALGETLSVTAEVAREVLITALREAGPLIREAAPAVQEFARAIGGVLVEGLQVVGPLLTGFATFLSDNAAVIQVVTPLLAGLVLGFGALKILTTVVGWVRGVATVIGSLGLLIGPGGAVLLGLGLAATALALFSQENQNSEEAARENQAAIDGLKDTLNQLTGAATGATQAQIAQDLVGRKLADGTTLLRDALGRAGISLADFTEAAVGNPAAIAAVDAQLSRVAATLPGVRQLFDDNRIGLDAIGLSFEEFAGLVSRGAEGYGELNARVRELGGTFTFTEESVRNAAGELGEVGSEFERLRGQVQEAGEQVRVAAQAGADFTTVLEAIGAGLSSLANGAAPTRLMADNLRVLAASAQDAAIASADAALAAGGDLAGAAREAAASMLESRNAFIAAAEAAGVARPQAEALANQLGLIPAAVQTQVLLDAEGVDAELVTLASQFAAVPNEKSIIVNTLSEDATIALQTLGFIVETLPEGQIKITENDDEARAGLADIVGDVGATVATFDLDAEPALADGVITTTLAFADGSVGVLTIDANGQPATIEVNGQLARINSETGVLTIDGNPNPANEALNGQIVVIDRATGTLRILANDQDVVNAKNRAQQPTFSTHTIRVTVTGEVLGRGNTGLAGGGLIGRRRRGVGFAGGGMVLAGYGPGRDTVGPLWLSPGEAVLVPELVRQIGAANILRWNRIASGGRRATVAGDWPGFAGGGMVGRSWLTDSASIPMRRDGAPLILAAPSQQPSEVVVTVLLDGQPVRAAVRAAIQQQDHESARTLLVGRGVTW